MKRLLLLAALGAAAAAFSLGALAQQYKWVDKDGRVRYGDVPPPGVKATPLRPPPRPSSPPPSSSAGAKKGEKAKPLTPEQAFQKRREEQQEQDQKAAKERAAAEEKRANCAQAQSNLRGIQAGARVATTNAAGERVFLDDAEIAKERERAQRAVSDWCG